MNASLLVGLIVGGVAVAVYHAAHRAAQSAADRVERRVARTLPGFCEDCGDSQLTRAGLCATCGSSAIWNPGSLGLPPQAMSRSERQRFIEDVTARAIARAESSRVAPVERVN